MRSKLLVTAPTHSSAVAALSRGLSHNAAATALQKYRSACDTFRQQTIECGNAMSFTAHPHQCSVYHLPFAQGQGVFPRSARHKSYAQGRDLAIHVDIVKVGVLYVRY